MAALAAAAGPISSRSNEAAHGLRFLLRKLAAEAGLAALAAVLVLSRTRERELEGAEMVSLSGDASRARDDLEALGRELAL